MNDLIKALTILAKYNGLGEDKYPTHCEHDELIVNGVQWSELSVEDQVALDKLGFHDGDCGVTSFRFGSN
ncbi:MAG: hypothetical protein EBT92_14465 [Planctomycetes bacterium]|nr:hypothetical protein [Planctomycetota bacterium]